MDEEVGDPTWATRSADEQLAGFDSASISKELVDPFYLFIK